MRLIDVDKLNAEMYHEAFETDTDLQKWESGCWIRYKMYENATDNAPTVDAVPMSVIEDIKAEIEQFKNNEHTYEYGGFDRAYNGIMNIIDKHISEDMRGDTE